MKPKAKRKSIILVVAHIALCTLCLVFALFGVDPLTAYAEESATKVYDLNLTMTGYEWGKNIADVTITGEEDKITIDSIQFKSRNQEVVTSGTFKARQYTVAIFITPKSGYDISECTKSTVKINSESVYLFNTSGCNTETGQRQIFDWLDELTIPDGAEVPEIKSLSLKGITAPTVGNTIPTSTTVTATASIENPDGSTETKTDALTFSNDYWTAINLYSSSGTSSETEYHSGNTYLFRIRYSLNDDYIGLSADNITVNGAPEGTTVRLDSNGTILVLFPTLDSDELRLAEPEMEQIPAGYLGTWLYYEARFAGGKYPYTVEIDHSNSWINSFGNDSWSGYPTGISCKAYRPTTTQPEGSITLKVTDANGTVKNFTVSVGAVTEDPNAIKEIRLNYTIPAVGASCPTVEEIKNAITLPDDLEWDTTYTPVARWVVSGTPTSPTTFEKYGTYELQLRLKIKDESAKTFAGGSLLEGKIVSGDKEYKASFATCKEKSVTFCITVDAYGNNIEIVTDKIECKVGIPFTGKIVLSGVESGDEIVIDKNYASATNLTFGTDGSITGTPTSAGTYSVEIRVWWKTVGGTLLAKKNVQVVIEDRTAIDVPIGKTLKYNGSEQTGVESGAGYTLSGTVNSTDVGSYDVTVMLEPGYKWTDGSLYNKTVTWNIVKGDRVAPTGITAENASNGASDGKITGVTTEMEYRASDISSYTACTGTEITGLKKGTYYVRFKENANYNASSDFAVTVGEDDVVTHNVTVMDGTGSGIYEVGVSVTIKANEPAKGMVFDKWEVVSGSIALADEYSATTTFVMPDSEVIVKATYKTAPHTHSYGTEWKSDADKHWHECDCGAKNDEETHTAGDWIIDTEATATTDGTKHKECTVCHRVLENGTIPATGSAEHTHSYGTEWKSDADKHWHECDCGAKKDEEAHTAGDWIIDTEATANTEGTKHKECTECGYVMETDTIPATGVSHTHSYGSKWETDSDKHWHECDCGAKVDEEPHVDANNDGKCDICDHEMGNADNPGGEIKPEKTGLSGGAITGIVIGSLAVAGLGGFSIFWFVIKKKKFADLISLFKK